MSVQVAVRIPRQTVETLDAAVAAGAFENRASAVREALARLLDELREAEVARAYEAAYGAQPQDSAIGEAGAALASEVADPEVAPSD